MTKSSKPKKKQEASANADNNSIAIGKIGIGGDVSGNIQVANIINNFETTKTTYGLFTIPAPVTDFTGREAELEGLKASFTNGAIITGLSGAGGIGKSELARKLAHDIADSYPDAQINIDLLGTSEKPTSPEDAMRRLLEPFHAGQKLPDDETQLKNLYQHTFGKKKVLLLLDNASNAAQVRPLIPPAPSAAIITSRQHFSLTEFGLHEPLRLDVLSPEKACEFLCSASPKLNASPDEEVNELAKLCGHLPLALRVAASLLNDRSDWTVNTLLNRLQDEHTRLKHLKREGDYDVEAMLNLSYELLTDDLKKYFRALGIFTAPFAKISARAVLEIEDNVELDDVLGKLIGRSLLYHQEAQEIVEDLYSMHDLTRLYATQKLLEEKEYEDTLAYHAEHFLEWASKADKLYLKGNENIFTGLAQFRFIWIHLYSAYKRLLPEQKTRPQNADRWLSDFPSRCVNVLDLHIPPREGVLIFQTALDCTRRLGKSQDKGNALSKLALKITRKSGDQRDEGKALSNLGNAYADLGEARKAIGFHEQALRIAREIGDQRDEGRALSNLGNAYADLGEARKAIGFHEQALRIAREIGDQRDEGNILGNLGLEYTALGETRKAIEFYEKHMEIARKIGDRRGEGTVLGSLGSAYWVVGEVNRAIEFYEQAMNIAEEVGDRHGEGTVLGNLGNAYAALGDAHNAIRFYEGALIIDREISDRRGEGADLSNLGLVYASLGETRKAVEFYEHAIIIAREIGDRRVEGANLDNLGSAYADLGDAKKAIEFYEQALSIAREISDRRGEGQALGDLGCLHSWMGDYKLGARYLVQASEILTAIGSPNAEWARNSLKDITGYWYEREFKKGCLKIKKD